MSTKNVKSNDRVRRVNQTGCFGTVQDVRSEVTASSSESKEKGLMVTVLWDNGTYSYFAPEGLEVIESH